MLAEPVKQTSYVLQPRGKPLYEDENHEKSFGMRMLTKMGWNKDKGLGAKEDGAKDFIRIRYKNASTGMGFQDRDSQWTEHEEKFTKLLDNLGGTEEVEEDPRKCESLEEKSKKSRARVHYKKFTRGKDLSQYSEKDLANIFGRKSLKLETPAEEAVVDENGMSSSFGVQTSTSRVSSAEYFKQKMSGNVQEKSEDAEEPPRKCKKKKRGKEVDEENPRELPKEEIVDKNEGDSIENPPEKKKRKKKQVNQELDAEETPEEAQDPEKPKKKRKSKAKEAPEVTQEPAEVDIEASGSQTVAEKSKKKRKQKEAVLETPEEEPTKKKKKAPKKDEEKLSLEAEDVPPEMQEILAGYTADGGVTYKLPLRHCDLFLNLDLKRMKGSNVHSFIGYGLSEKIDLDVIESHPKKQQEAPEASQEEAQDPENDL